jgi:hypothetical protein
MDMGDLLELELSKGLSKIGATIFEGVWFKLRTSQSPFLSSISIHTSHLGLEPVATTSFAPELYLLLITRKKTSYFVGPRWRITRGQGAKGGSPNAKIVDSNWEASSKFMKTETRGVYGLKSLKCNCGTYSMNNTAKETQHTEECMTMSNLCQIRTLIMNMTSFSRNSCIKYW